MAKTATLKPVKPLSREEIQAILLTLGSYQLAFLAARMHVDTDREALEIAGCSAGYMQTWPKKIRDDIDAIVWTLQQAPILEATEIARQRLKLASNEAVDTLLDELHGRRGSRNRVEAAKTILDRVGVIALSRVEIAPVGKGYVNVSPDVWDEADATVEAASVKLLTAGAEAEAVTAEEGEDEQEEDRKG